MTRIRTHTNPFNYYRPLEKVDFKSIFNRDQLALDLEVGFGRGVFIRHYAKNNPDRQIIGVEVRKGVVTLLQERIQQDAIQNIHCVHGNAQRCLEDMIEEKQLETIFVFHPDPWLKKRHFKRRVINSQFLEVMCQKLKPNGRIYLSTDVSSLWEWMTQVLSQDSRFIQIQDDAFWQMYYTSHWHQFCQKNNRTIFLGVFEFQPQ